MSNTQSFRLKEMFFLVTERLRCCIQMKCSARADHTGSFNSTLNPAVWGVRQTSKFSGLILIQQSHPREF